MAISLNSCCLLSPVTSSFLSKGLLVSLDYFHYKYFWSGPGSEFVTNFPFFAALMRAHPNTLEKKLTAFAVLTNVQNDLVTPADGRSPANRQFFTPARSLSIEETRFIARLLKIHISESHKSFNRKGSTSEVLFHSTKAF
jgi:hypothetical protein